MLAKKKTRKNKFWVWAILLFLLVAIPLTIYQVYRTQTYQGEAATSLPDKGKGTPKFPPVCNPPMIPGFIRYPDFPVNLKPGDVGYDALRCLAEHYCDIYHIWSQGWEGRAPTDLIISRAAAISFIVTHNMYKGKWNPGYLPVQGAEAARIGAPDLQGAPLLFTYVATARYYGFLTDTMVELVTIGQVKTFNFNSKDPWEWGFCGFDTPCTTKSKPITYVEFLDKAYQFGLTNGDYSQCSTSTGTPAGASPQRCMNGDVNGDGKVDGTDIGIVISNFGK